MAHLDLTPDQLLSTTRAVRKRLDLTRPVERELLLECVGLATQAPTGSNSQGWHFVLVEDATTKIALAELYAKGFDPYISYIGTSAVEYPEGDSRRERQERVRESAIYLREHFHEVPWMLIPCAAGRLPDGAPNFAGASFYGSILPAVWNFMLAARARGLGTAWTTLHLAYEREAAELVGIPYDQVSQVGLMPVAYTKGTDFRPAPRIPLEQVVHIDRW
jgi:nitroreductase